MWTADLKRRTNLQQPQINKALKNLEGRSFVKSVKTVMNKNRKVYMLFELTPSREITGGAIYIEQDYDAEFVDVVKQQCLQFITRQGWADLEAIASSSSSHCRDRSKRSRSRSSRSWHGLGLDAESARRRLVTLFLHSSSGPHRHFCCRSCPRLSRVTSDRDHEFFGSSCSSFWNSS